MFYAGGMLHKYLVGFLGYGYRYMNTDTSSRCVTVRDGYNNIF
jgi:hypothetical protein